MTAALRAPAPPCAPSSELARVVERLRARLWRLDLASLIAALQAVGVCWEDLRFASHASTLSASRLIQDVDLVPELQKVRITLNLGLASAQSPLPSYFWKELDAGRLDAATFFRFLGFFDHVALSRHALAVHPELDALLFPDRERARREEVQLLNIRSTATLHWLFQQVFPELELRVEPAVKERHLRTEGLCLGSAVLGGDGTFGSRAPVLGPGRCVTLFSDDERAASGEPWPLEARARVDALLLPLLRPVDAHIEVFLVVREQQSWARLAAGSHLGYDQLRGGTRARRRVKVYDTSEQDTQ